MNDHCEPFYQTHSFPEKDAYNAIKMEICSDPPTGIRRKVRAIVPDINDLELEIIRNNVILHVILRNNGFKPSLAVIQ